jgi:AcrR family transcriptional regulator
MLVNVNKKEANLKTKDRQEEIISAAKGIIAERGLEALTIENIAERVGFSGAAVYRHFRNKAQIMETIIDLFAGSSARLLAEIHGCGGSSLDKIKLFFLDRCRVFSSDRVLATVMFSEHLFQNDPALAAKVHHVLRSHRRLLLQIIRDGQRRNLIRRLPAEHLFTIIMGALRLLVLKWRISGHDFNLLHAGENLWYSLEELLDNPKKGKK